MKINNMIFSKERLLEVGLSPEEIESFGYMHFNIGDNRTEYDLTDEEVLEMIDIVRKLRSRTSRSK